MQRIPAQAAVLRDTTIRRAASSVQVGIVLEAHIQQERVPVEVVRLLGPGLGHLLQAVTQERVAGEDRIPGAAFAARRTVHRPCRLNDVGRESPSDEVGDGNVLSASQLQRWPPPAQASGSTCDQSRVL